MNRFLCVPICVVSFVVPALALAHSHSTSGWFSQLQLGYQFNTASKERSTVSVVQRSGGGTQTINYDTTSISASPSFAFSGGYQFQLKNHWLMNLGETLQFTQFDVKGQASSSAFSSYNYQYDINAMTFKTFMQLIYRVNHWQMLAGINVGLSILDSREYTMTSTTLSEGFDPHTSYHLAYGADIGFGRVLDKTDTVSFIVNYENLGSAKSGQRQLAVGTNTGDLHQKLRTLGFFVNLTHRF